MGEMVPLRALGTPGKGLRGAVLFWPSIGLMVPVWALGTPRKELRGAVSLCPSIGLMVPVSAVGTPGVGKALPTGGVLAGPLPAPGAQAAIVNPRPASKAREVRMVHSPLW